MIEPPLIKKKCLVNSGKDTFLHFFAVFSDKVLHFQLFLLILHLPKPCRKSIGTERPAGHMHNDIASYKTT